MMIRKKLLPLLLILSLVISLCVSESSADQHEDYLMTKKVVSGEDGEDKDTWEYEYDSEGHVTKIKMMFIISGEPTTSEETYEYDDKGNLIQFRDVGEGEEGKGDNTFTYTNTYDSLDRLIKVIEKRRYITYEMDTPNISDMTVVYEYTYDGNSDRIACTTMTYLDSGTVTTTTFDYDEKGNKVREEYWDNTASPGYSNITEYAYDDYGNLIKSKIPTCT